MTIIFHQSRKETKNFGATSVQKSSRDFSDSKPWTLSFIFCSKNQNRFSCNWVFFSLFEGKKENVGFCKKQLGLNKHVFVHHHSRRSRHSAAVLVEGGWLFAEPFKGCSDNWEKNHCGLRFWREIGTDGSNFLIQLSTDLEHLRATKKNLQLFFAKETNFSQKGYKTTSNTFFHSC